MGSCPLLDAFSSFSVQKFLHKNCFRWSYPALWTSSLSLPVWGFYFTCKDIHRVLRSLGINFILLGLDLRFWADIVFLLKQQVGLLIFFVRTVNLPLHGGFSVPLFLTFFCQTRECQVIIFAPDFPAPWREDLILFQISSFSVCCSSWQRWTIFLIVKLIVIDLCLFARTRMASTTVGVELGNWNIQLRPLSFS